MLMYEHNLAECCSALLLLYLCYSQDLMFTLFINDSRVIVYLAFHTGYGLFSLIVALAFILICKGSKASI